MVRIYEGCGNREWIIAFDGRVTRHGRRCYVCWLWMKEEVVVVEVVLEEEVVMMRIELEPNDGVVRFDPDVFLKKMQLDQQNRYHYCRSIPHYVHVLLIAS
jgi:hypothetical protein